MSSLRTQLETCPPHRGEEILTHWDHDLFERLESFATSYVFQLAVTQPTVSRQDNPGGMRERYRPAIELRGHGIQRLDAAQASRLITQLEGSWFTRLFRPWPLGPGGQ